MKKQQGFTLVELLSVVLILGLLMTIAFFGIRETTANIKNKMYCTKVKTIEQAAVLWGDSQSTLTNLNAGDSYKNAPAITIQKLIDAGFIKKDDMQNIKTVGGKETGDVVDPRDNSSMNTKKVHVYIRNNRINAQFADAESVCK